MANIRVEHGDITKVHVDVIVNAANAALSGGGGVDGAIHRAAGTKLVAECRTHKRCEIGSAVLTGAYNLPAKHVVHCVGPVWYGGHKDEESLLQSTLEKAFQLAKSVGAQSIAIPAISCGAYRFPVDKAASVSVKVALEQGQEIEVVFVCFEKKVFRAFEKTLHNAMQG